MKGNFSSTTGKIILTTLVFVLSIAHSFSESVALAWDASPSPNIVGYTVSYGNKSGVYSSQVDAGNQTSVVVEGIDRGMSYFFVVMARSFDGGISLPSNEVNLPAQTIESVTGTYNALFTGPLPEQKSGFFTLKKGSRASFTGSIKLDGKQFSFSGKFDSTGFAEIAVKRQGSSPLTLQLNLAPSNPDRLAVVLSDAWTIEFSADQTDFNSVNNSAPYAGKYTIALANATVEASSPELARPAPIDSSPEGIGFATVRVMPNGLVRVLGNLGDGEKFLQSTFVSNDGTWPCYVPVYKKAGLISGLLTFQPGEVDPRGNLTWKKPAVSKHRFYPAGFSTSVAVVGSPYIAPATLTNRVVNVANGTFIWDGSNPAGGLAKDVILLPNNRIVPVTPGEDRLTVKIKKDVGTFTGSIKLPGHGRPVKFIGGFLQNQNAGYGLFLGAQQSGQLIFESTE